VIHRSIGEYDERQVHEVFSARAGTYDAK
jgi:hypothetical protein